MELDEIRYEKADGVAEIVLDRPDALNPISASDGGTRDQILWALHAAEADDEVGCVLLRGAGRAFSAGGDLTGNERRETEEEHAAFLAKAAAFHDGVRSAAVPTVAAVHGHCLGAALDLVACCDLVVAGTSSRFGLPEGRMGLVGVAPLVPLIGRQWAKFLMLTGEPVDAATAERIGLCISVEADGELLERARDLCGRIARMPRESTVLTKRTVDAVADAAGDVAGRAAADVHDLAALLASSRATAPDGRTFREVVETEGVAGLKSTLASQWSEPWRRSSDPSQGA
jgi:enoyl-CoA hydratase/carnithine racemase